MKHVPMVGIVNKKLGCHWEITRWSI